MRKGNLFRYMKLGLQQRQKPWPHFLILYVNSKCNYRCKHCFINWDQVASGPADLSYDEIETLAIQLGENLPSVSLTGGEPTLREDLVDIARLFVEKCNTRNLFIPTNGSLENRTVEVIEQICGISPNVNVGVTVSLDGMADTHNEIRGIQGGFDDALRTADALSSLKMHHKNLETGFIMTLCQHNINEAREVAEFLESRLPNSGVTFNLYRESNTSPGFGTDLGHLVAPGTSGVNLPEIEELKEFLDWWSTRNEKKSPRSINNLLTNAGRRFLAEKNIETILKNEQVIECLVYRMYLVVYANGDTAFCELRAPFGNIREHAFDELWFGSEAEKQRKAIADGRCNCTHECFQPMNVATNPRYYPKIIGSYVKHLWNAR